MTPFIYFDVLYIIRLIGIIKTQIVSLVILLPLSGLVPFLRIVVQHFHRPVALRSTRNASTPRCVLGARESLQSSDEASLNESSLLG